MKEAAMIPKERLDFSPIEGRPPLRLPDGVRMVIWPVIALEDWDVARPMARTVIPPPQGQPLLPDVPNWSWHEYGMRVGFWRLKRMLERLHIAPTVTLNARTCESYPQVVEACVKNGWELNAHSYEQIPMHRLDDERAVIQRSVEIIAKFSGTRPRGWFGPGLTQTLSTLDHLAEAGIEYIGDWARDGQVTLANWRTSPFNRWAFHHVREVVASADIPNDPANVWELPSAPVDLGKLRIDELCDETDTDGLVILHRGRIVFERYANGMTAESPHILMSVSKSLLGLLAGVLAARNVLDPDRLVTDVIPEVSGTAYDGATIRHLLDVRAGIAFDEDYLATSGPIVAYRKAVNWNPRRSSDLPTDLRSFYRELTKSSGPHGGPFNYVSPNTDLLGWVIERATSQRYVDLMSELLWRPLGATRSAYITVDRLGAPRCAGGVCTTVRDLARVGQLLVQGGARGSTPIVPVRWIDDITLNGDRDAWAAGNGSEFFPGLPLRYRSKWYVQDGAAPLLFGFGIHGQFLIVDRTREIVIAKVSSQALPIDVARIAVTMRAVAAIIEFLAHL